MKYLNLQISIRKPNILFRPKCAKNFKNLKKKLNDINDIINFKFNEIECGKFALSKFSIQEKVR